MLWGWCAHVEVGGGGRFMEEIKTDLQKKRVEKAKKAKILAPPLFVDNDFFFIMANESN